MNPSNPVSHASGEADTPFCFAVVGTSPNPKIKDWYAGSWQHEANADRAVEINNASSRSVARQLGEEVSSTYRKEPLCLASTLSSLRAEHDALLHFAGSALKETRTTEMGDWDGGDLEVALTESGLLEIKNPVVPCGASCRCVEFYDAGDIAVCYAYTDLAQKSLASLENADKRSA